MNGVDALLIGAADLSTSEGRSETDPVVLTMIQGAIRDTKAAGVPIGNAGGPTAASVQAAVDVGYSFTLMSNDASLLGGAAATAFNAGRSVSYA